MDQGKVQMHFAEDFLAEKWEKPAAKGLCSDLALGQVERAGWFAARRLWRSLAVDDSVWKSQHRRLRFGKAVLQGHSFVRPTADAGCSGHLRLHQPHWSATDLWWVIRRLVFQIYMGSLCVYLLVVGGRLEWELSWQLSMLQGAEGLVDRAPELRAQRAEGSAQKCWILVQFEGLGAAFADFRS